MPDTEAVQQVKNRSTIMPQFRPRCNREVYRRNSIFFLPANPHQAVSSCRSGGIQTATFPWPGRVKLRCFPTPARQEEDHFTIVQVWFSIGHPEQRFPCSPSNQQRHWHREGELASDRLGCPGCSQPQVGKRKHGAEGACGQLALTLVVKQL